MSTRSAPRGRQAKAFHSWWMRQARLRSGKEKVRWVLGRQPRQAMAMVMAGGNNCSATAAPWSFLQERRRRTKEASLIKANFVVMVICSYASRGRMALSQELGLAGSR